MWNSAAISSSCPPDTADEVQILYDASGPYGWVGELHAKQLANLLGHFPLAYQIRAVENYHAGDLEAFRATFYLGTVFNNSLPPEFPLDILATRKPVCWFKYNLWKLSNGMAFESRFGFRFEFTDMTGFSTISYKGENFSKHPGDPDIGRVTIVNSSLAHAPALAWRDSSAGSIPYVVRGSNLWYVADSPFSYMSEEDRYLVFADLLHDILQIAHPESHQALIRLEDIDPTYPIELLQRAADYLHGEGVPFGVAVVPVYSDPLGRYNDGIPEHVPISDAPEFVATLKSMVSKGGQIVMHGYTHQYDSVINPDTGVTGDDYEFWRVTTNGAGSIVEYRPLAEDSVSWVMARLSAGLQEFQQTGLRPVAWETPHYAASALDYQVFATNFSLTTQRAIYFDHSENYIAGQFFPYFIHRDTYGQQILPENLGNIDPTALPNAPARLPADLIRAARKNRVLRDAYASAFFHPYLDLSYLQQLVSGIKALGYTYVPLSGIGPPVITTPPASRTICRGTRVTLSVTATGALPLSFQWRFNGADISGATNSTFVIANAQPANAGAYTVIISNSVAKTTSVPATLKVVAAFAITEVTLRANTLRFSFATENGLTYLVEYKGRLSDEVWAPLTTLNGNGGKKQVTDSTGAAGPRFYRVRVE